MKKGDIVRLMDMGRRGRYERDGIVVGDVGIVTKAYPDIGDVYCNVAFFRSGCEVGDMLATRYEIVELER
jgi:hypothetical protein